MTDLSICIVTLEERKALLDRVLAYLQPQIDRLPNGSQRVEILTECDNRQHFIGTKRNRLVQRASGKFIAFVDDDDLVDDSYVRLIADLISADPSMDCVGIRGHIYFGKTTATGHQLFIHSITSKGWYSKDGIYYRTPNHLNPIRAEHCRLFPYKEVNHGEDQDFSDRIYASGVLRRERMIDHVLYHYLFDNTK